MVSKNSNELYSKINYIDSHKSLFLNTKELTEISSFSPDDKLSFQKMSEIYMAIDNDLSQNRKIKNNNEITLNKGDKIYFNDENLKTCILDFLEKPYDSDIYVDDIIDIVELNLSEKNIESISGLEYFLSLESLSLYSNHITDLSPLRRLINLKKLYLSRI